MVIQVQNLLIEPYSKTFSKMINYTSNRTDQSSNQLWCVEHNSVFTQGRHGDDNHIINTHSIPVIQTDRGGQITYHSLGQAVIYFLFDLKQIKLGIKYFVSIIESACIDMLTTLGISAYTINGAPGIYVDSKKIASLGLRVRNKKTYHGIAINTDMDLTPFTYINPCGYKKLKMCQIIDYNTDATVSLVFDLYSKIFKQYLER